MSREALVQIGPKKVVAPLSAGLLADQVADHIVESIARRELVSGEKLIETELAETLGVSRVPVREATRILASQGIVIPTPRRGMRVSNFDRAWAVQLRNARVAIEQLAARIVAEKVQADPGLISPLLEQVEKIDREVEHPAEGWFSINQADIAFHALVFEIAASPLLSTLWSGIARHVLIMFAFESYRDTEFKRVETEHHSYVAALQSGDPDQLDREIEKHVARARIFDGEM